jgi:hypothetical protein
VGSRSRIPLESYSAWDERGGGGLASVDKGVHFVRDGRLRQILMKSRFDSRSN